MIVLDFKDRRPIYEQVADKMKELMLLDVMKPDQPLPSVRNMATDLSINPNTIQRAYAELEREGYIYTVKGKGSFVAEVRDMRENKKRDVLEHFCEVAREAASLGIPRDDLVRSLKSQYGAEGKETGGEDE